jgi:hypothetical protein
MTGLIEFLALVLAALSMSVHFGTWLVEAPLRATQSGSLFTEVQQGRDRVASRVMPILSNAAIGAIAASVVLMRSIPGALTLSLLGLALFIADEIVTLAGNLPINRRFQSWNAAAPPSDWRELRDRWERLHSLRTLLIVFGFASFAASVVLFKQT